MTDIQYLKTIEGIAPTVKTPHYTPDHHGSGIVHIGLGAFLRAHLALYTDEALGQAGGDWRITGINLRSTEIVEALNRQNGLYTLIERGEERTTSRIIGSIEKAIAASQNINQCLSALVDPQTRIVSLTVTEKAYGIDRVEQAVSLDMPAIAHDLVHPQTPIGVIGLLVEALRQRWRAQTTPFTILCCDNLPDNGGLLRMGVLDFAGRIDGELRDWISDHVAFPSTMVDRITPASSEKTFEDAREMTGFTDLAAVETEPFSQWIIEDRFSQGRPCWEAGGAVFVDDVAPYEEMKLRMLNGAHSLIAYSGYLSGYKYVRDVMAEPLLVELVKRHLSAASKTLGALDQINLADYARELIQRFANPAIAHETYQIAMDGTEKIPQRLLNPAVQAVENGQDCRPFAFAIAAWMRYCLGRSDRGESYQIRDPRGDEISKVLANAGGDPQKIVDALHDLPGLFPIALRNNTVWTSTLVSILSTMLADGMNHAIIEEVRVMDETDQ